MPTAALRLAFKQIKKATSDRHQNMQIRVHRSLSWLERALELKGDTNAADRLLFGWIAFNALYGEWDESEGFPKPDRQTWRAFLDRMAKLPSADAALGPVLLRHRPTMLALLKNPYLDPALWKSPATYRRRPVEFDFGNDMRDRKWSKVLCDIVDRIYVARGQVVHGAATRGSKLNQATMRDAATVLCALLLVFVDLILRHRVDDDWPPPCYPPLPTDPPAARTPRRTR